MPELREIELDLLIFGGGVAGLWLLDHAVRAGHNTLLLEAGRLGSGQTAASQGIIHGGLKYTLDGLLNASAERIRDMPQLWADCLAGRREPHLTQTRIRAPFCYLWRTASLKSQLGMIGARVGLRVGPVRIPRDELPPALAACPGDVFRLDEQVISPVSLVAELAGRHHGRILKTPDHPPPHAERDGDQVTAVRLTPPNGEPLTLRPRTIALTAGAGNEALRRVFALPDQSMQRRPLHMLLVRGKSLPQISGHCIDGGRTRVTITSEVDTAGRVVWQIGGQISEDGVPLSPSELIARARRELAAVLPGVRLDRTESSTYRVDRAEQATPGGRRPSDVSILREGNVITAWPTKMALAPRLAENILAQLPPPHDGGGGVPAALAGWPRPAVAPPPWEEEGRTWTA